VKLTGYLEFLIAKWCGGKVRSLTPREAGQRGAQLSLVVPGAGRDLEGRLHKKGVWVDFREPDVFRAAPAALYNSFTDVRKFVGVLRDVIG
jgi:kynureninase